MTAGKPIWHTPVTPAGVDRIGDGSLPGALGMRCVEVGDDFLRMSMPVDARTRQPWGLLHGGASVALGETIGGVASGHVVAPGYRVVGLEINANHVRSVRDGQVIATCRPLHLGRTTHVWDIRVETPEGKLVSVIRLTNAILPPEPEPAPGHAPDARRSDPVAFDQEVGIQDRLR